MRALSTDTSCAAVLVFDGDCGFCTRVAGLIPHLHAEVGVVASQHADLAALGLSAQQCEQALQFVDTDGTISSGIDAVAQLLRHSRLPLPLLGAGLRLPGLHALGELVYAWVATHRHQLPGGTPACAMPAPNLAADA